MDVPDLEVPGILLDLDTFAVVVPDSVVGDLVPAGRVLPDTEDHDTDSASSRVPDFTGIESRASGLVELLGTVHDDLQTLRTFYHEPEFCTLRSCNEAREYYSIR